MVNADGWAAAPAECRWAVAGCGWVARDHFLPGLLEAAAGLLEGPRGRHGSRGTADTDGAGGSGGPHGVVDASGAGRIDAWTGSGSAPDAPHDTGTGGGTGRTHYKTGRADGQTDPRDAHRADGPNGTRGANSTGGSIGPHDASPTDGSDGTHGAGRTAAPVPRLVAVTDRDPSAAALLAGRAPGARTSAGLAELLAAYRPDALYVATPNHAHRPAVEAAAAAGVAVLCEKPLAADLGEAEHLVAACRRAGVLAATAFDQRFHPAHRAVRDAVAAGELGTVTAVRITYCCWLPPAWSPDGRPYDNWRADPARAGGGAALDLAPHGLDLVGVLLGGDDVAELTALVQHRVHPYPVDDGAVLTGRTGGDVLATLHLAYNTPDALPRRRLEVVGTRGQLTATDTLGQDAGGMLLRTDARTGDRVPVPFDTGVSPFAEQVREFSGAVAAVRGGTPVERAWPWPLRRDLALHRLLLGALSRAAPSSAPSSTPSSAPPPAPVRTPARTPGRTPGRRPDLATAEEGRR